MPRTRRDQPAQAIASQAYGVKNEQLEAQKQMPLPASDPPPAAMPSNTDAVNVLQAAAAFDPAVTPLSAATERPDEPVTAGLPIGAGPGTEALPSTLVQQRTNAMIDKLQLVADLTGDPWLAALVARARGGSGAG